MSDSVRPHRQQPTRLPHPWATCKAKSQFSELLLFSVKEKASGDTFQGLSLQVKTYWLITYPLLEAGKARGLKSSPQPLIPGPRRNQGPAPPRWWGPEVWPEVSRRQHFPYVTFVVTAQHCQFGSVQSLSRVQLSATPWTAACQGSLSITNSQSSPKLMSIESVMPSNRLILCCFLLLLPSIFPSIRVFSNKSALHIWRPKYWSFSFSISPSNEYSFRMEWLDLLAVQGTLKSLFQTHNSKASIFGALLSSFYIHT